MGLKGESLHFGKWRRYSNTRGLLFAACERLDSKGTLGDSLGEVLFATCKRLDSKGTLESSLREEENRAR